MGIVDAIQRKLQAVGGTRTGDKLLSMPTTRLKRKKDYVEAPDVNAIIQALITQLGQSQPARSIAQADTALGEAMGPLATPTKIGRGIGKAVTPAAAGLATYMPEMAWRAGQQGALRATDPNMALQEKAGRIGMETALPMGALLAGGALANALPAAPAAAPFIRRLGTNALNMAPVGALFGGASEGARASTEGMGARDVAMQGLKGAGQGALASAAFGAAMTPFGVRVGRTKKPMTEAEFEALQAREQPYMSAREKALASGPSQAIHRPELRAQAMQNRAQQNAELSASIDKKFGGTQKGSIDPFAPIGATDTTPAVEANRLNLMAKQAGKKPPIDKDMMDFIKSNLSADDWNEMEHAWNPNDPRHMGEEAEEIVERLAAGLKPKGTQGGYFTPFGDVKAVGKGKPVTAGELAGGQEVRRKIGNIEVIFNGGEDGDSLYVGLGKKKLSPEVAQQIAEAAKQSGLPIEVGNPATSGGFEGMGDWYDEPAKFLKAYGGGKTPKAYTYKPDPKQVSTMEAFVRKAKSLGKKTWQEAAGEADYTEDLFYKNLNYDRTKDALVTPQGDFGASDKGASKMIDLMRQYEIAKQALSKKKIGGSQAGFIEPFADIGPSKMALQEGADLTGANVTGPSKLAKGLMRTQASEPVFSITGGPELGDKGFLPTLNEPFSREKTTIGNFDKLVATEFREKSAHKPRMDKAEFYKDLADSLNVIQTYSNIANEKIPAGQPRAQAIDKAMTRFKDMIVKNHDVTARGQTIYVPNEKAPWLKGKGMNVLDYVDMVLKEKDPVNKVIMFDAFNNAQHERGNIITMDLDLHGSGVLRTRVNAAVNNWLNKLRDFQPNVTQAVERKLIPSTTTARAGMFDQKMRGRGGFTEITPDVKRAIADTLGLAALPVAGASVYSGAKRVSSKIGEAFDRRFK